MHTIRRLLLGSVLMVGMGYAVDDQTTSVVETNKPQPVVTIEPDKGLAVEQEKWRYLRGQFGFEMNEIKPLSRRVGEIINDIKLPAAWIASVLGVLSINFYFRNHHEIKAEVLMFSPLAFISYHILKQLGDFLEDKPYVCMQSLEQFLRSWQTVHKALCPHAMQATFDALYADAQQNDGELTVIDEEQAKKIVEGVVATALIVETVK